MSPERAPIYCAIVGSAAGMRRYREQTVIGQAVRIVIPGRPCPVLR